MIRTWMAGALLAVAAATPVLAGAVTPVPEPGTMMLVGGGIAATILIVRRRSGKGKGTASKK